MYDAQNNMNRIIMILVMSTNIGLQKIIIDFYNYM